MPRLGTTITFSAAMVGFRSPTWRYWVGLSDQTCGGYQLPIITFLTVPCFVYVCPLMELTTNPSGTLSLPIPADPVLMGLKLHLQAWTAETPHPLLVGRWHTNYATIVIG